MGSLNIHTEGIKYAGSKAKLLPYILDNVSKYHPKTVLDGFAGTTRVSQALSNNGYITLCNDLGEWSQVFGNAFLLNTHPASHYQKMIDELNNLTPVYGWFSEKYGGQNDSGSSVQADGKKRIWQLHNTMKLDAIRDHIDIMGLDNIEKSVLLCSLIFALDKVDNSLGHQASYLREWAKRSYNEMVLKIPSIHENTHKNYVYKKDIFSLLDESSTPSYDLAYYDPPYGSNNSKMPASRVRYQAYYHVWKTIILNDKPELFGAVNRREDSRDTNFYNPFEDFRINKDTNKYYSVEALGNLINKTNCNTILLSYATDNDLMFNMIKDEINCYGVVEDIIEINYKRNVMSTMRTINAWVDNNRIDNKELIFIIHKK